MRKSAGDKFDRLAAAEVAFAGAQFLAPVVRGHGVMVNIAGVRCKLKVDPVTFNGWGVFRANAHARATFVREASAAERQRYLRLLPAVRLIVCSVDRAKYRATPADLADERFQFAGTIAPQLCTAADLFETVLCRFDGAQVWFDRVDPRAEQAAAAYLRREMLQMAEPGRLERTGLTLGQQIAYATEYERRATAILADRRQAADQRLNRALAHAGAYLRDFTESNDA